MVEGLPTQRAHVGPFSGMDALVLNEVRELSKGFPTLQALMRLLTCVDLVVLSEV